MQYTEEQRKDIAERRQKFFEAYGKLREDLQMDFMSMPAFTPNERGSLDITMTMDIVDLKYMSVKSPIVVGDAS